MGRRHARTVAGAGLLGVTAVAGGVAMAVASSSGSAGGSDTTTFVAPADAPAPAVGPDVAAPPGVAEPTWIEPEAARDTAVSVVPGTVTGLDLDVESDRAVYTIEVRSADGTTAYVYVDATDGTVRGRARDDDDLEDAAEDDALRHSVTVDVAAASAAALAAVPGTVTGLDLDGEDGRVVYTVEVTAADGTTSDVDVDAADATVLRRTRDDDDDLDDMVENRALADSAGVDVAAATGAALSAVPGTVTKADLDEDGGVVVVQVEVLRDDGTEVDVLVDARDGFVLGQELDG
jgi:uncharacterized membrane protein YkoI